jgi:CBS domain-containing protein
MKLSEIMTTNVEVISPEDTLQDAARKMRDRDVGLLPVCDGKKLIGMLSDRDITIRAVAEGMHPTDIVGRDLATFPVL